MALSVHANSASPCMIPYLCGTQLNSALHCYTLHYNSWTLALELYLSHITLLKYACMQANMPCADCRLCCLIFNKPAEARQCLVQCVHAAIRGMLLCSACLHLLDILSVFRLSIHWGQFGVSQSSRTFYGIIIGNGFLLFFVFLILRTCVCAPRHSLYHLLLLIDF